jgi:hypothetical protein
LTTTSKSSPRITRIRSGYGVPPPFSNRSFWSTAHQQSPISLGTVRLPISGSRLHSGWPQINFSQGRKTLFGVQLTKSSDWRRASGTPYHAERSVLILFYLRPAFVCVLCGTDGLGGVPWTQYASKRKGELDGTRSDPCHSFLIRGRLLPSLSRLSNPSALVRRAGRGAT